MATPREPQQFIALKNTVPDDEARAAFSVLRTKPLAPSKGIPTDVEELKRRLAMLEAKMEAVVGLRSEDFRKRWNPMIDRVELEVGDIRDSNPKSNYVQNGGFRQWNAAITLPTGWTATNAPTISRVTARTGTQGGNYACRIAAGGSAGSISRTARVKAGSVHRLAGWVYLAASATATITLTDNGASPVVKVLTLVAGTGGIGAAGWFSFPRYGYDDLSIETASDATSVTIKLEAAANTTVDFSDIQLVQGPQADPDLWEPAPEDIESAPGIVTNGTYTPTATQIVNITTVTPNTFFYTKYGTQVIVSGTVLVDPVAAGATQYRLSLPVASNIGATSDLVGYTVHGPVAGLCGEVVGTIATDDATVGFITPDGTARTFNVNFHYMVI